MKILIYELGRSKRSVTIEVPTTKGTKANDIAEELVNAASSSGALMSSDISATWDASSGIGTIYAGFHAVGKAKVL